jgi:GTP-binding protein YchF
MLGIGIVGLPNVGKSTLFNAITKAGVEAANYPFATIDKNVGVVKVPDARLQALAQLFVSNNELPPIVPATVEFVDIAGLVKGASRGEGLGNQFLGNIREVAAIAHVVRCFDDDNVVHVDGGVDPLRDVETIDTELILADLATVEKRLDRVKRLIKNSADARTEFDVLNKVYETLQSGMPARSLDVDLPADLGLLTSKPVIFVCNVAEGDLVDGNAYVESVREHAATRGDEVVVVSAQIEQELADLGDEDAAAFLSDLGVTEPGLNRLIATGYRTLGLITFFTAGKKEVRAWTVARGATAPEAAGTIHTDMERGFIRAETIGWEALVSTGGYQEARSEGKLRTEGKDYVVSDGDVLHILFNV